MLPFGWVEVVIWHVPILWRGCVVVSSFLPNQFFPSLHRLDFCLRNAEIAPTNPEILIAIHFKIFKKLLSY